MIDALKPYPAYKDSGLPWLGAVPAHWEIRRNGRLFVQRNETGFPDLPILEVSLKTGVRVRDFDTSNRKQVMSDREKYKCARHGDIAYNMMRLWQGAVGVAPVDGLVSPAYVVARPLPETDSRYYEYVFRTGPYMNEVNRFSRGIVSDRNRLYWEDFKQMPSLFPPPAEQKLIARFLDHLERRARRYIRAKRRIIDLLDEQKQAIIHRAVTRGLDPSVPLQPSGIDWLGDVPSDWEVKRIKHVFHESDRRSGTGDGTLLSLTRSKGLVPHSEVSDRPPSASDFSKYKLCQPGQLVMNRMQAWSGMFAATTRDGLISPDYSVFNPLGNVHVQYFAFLFRTQRYIEQFALNSKGIGSGFNRLYTPEFGAIPVAVPPRCVQEDLMRWIESESRGLNTVIDHVNREIDLIHAYRCRVVADLVTGKMDVREVAACLPDEGDEKEPIDETDAIVDGDDRVDADTEPGEADT